MRMVNKVRVVKKTKPAAVTQTIRQIENRPNVYLDYLTGLFGGQTENSPTVNATFPPV